MPVMLPPPSAPIEINKGLEGGHIFAIAVFSALVIYTIVMCFKNILVLPRPGTIKDSNYDHLRPLL